MVLRMNNKLSLPVIICIAMMIVFNSCNEFKTKSSNEANDSASVERMSDEEIVLSLLKEWDKAINESDYEVQSQLFAPTVFFYTAEMSVDKVIENRKSLFAKHPDFAQYVKGTPTVTRLDSGDLKVSFVKHCLQNGNGKDYPSYLVFSKIYGQWKITKESDEVTDRNVQKRKVKVPPSAITGDFDGDGKKESVWVEGKKDSEGFYISKAILKSDNPAIGGLAWDNSYSGVELINVGKLDGGNRDYLGTIPFAYSTWCSYKLYVFRDGKWKMAIEPFTVWVGDDNYYRVFKDPKRKGNVIIVSNDMEAVDDDFAKEIKQSVPLMW